MHGWQFRGSQAAGAVEQPRISPFDGHFRYSFGIPNLASQVLQDCVQVSQLFEFE